MPNLGYKAEPRNRSVRVLLTLAEDRALSEMARRYHLSRSDVIRLKVFATAKPQSEIGERNG